MCPIPEQETEHLQRGRRCTTLGKVLALPSADPGSITGMQRIPQPLPAIILECMNKESAQNTAEFVPKTTAATTKSQANSRAA